MDGSHRSRRSSRVPWVSLGGPPEWLRLLEFVPSPSEGEVRHFGARNRISPRSRVRCLEGAAPFWASQRGTRHPDIDSRPLGAVFIRIWGESCTDRSSSRGPLVARPAALSPPHCATNLRARGARAVLADPNALLGWPNVTEAARLPGRGVEPQATNLRELTSGRANRARHTAERPPDSHRHVRGAGRRGLDERTGRHEDG